MIPTLKAETHLTQNDSPTSPSHHNLAVEAAAASPYVCTCAAGVRVSMCAFSLQV